MCNRFKWLVMMLIICGLIGCGVSCQKRLLDVEPATAPALAHAPAPVKMAVEEVALVASPQEQMPLINDIEIRAEARWMVLVIISSGPIAQSGSPSGIEKYQELRVTINNARSGLGPAATFNLPEGLSVRDITLTETANGVSLVVRMRGMVNGPVDIRSGNNQVGILLTKDAQPEVLWSMAKAQPAQSWQTAASTAAPPAFAQDLPKIAVSITGDSISINAKKSLSTIMQSKLVHSGRYTVVERTSDFIEAIDEEHRKQRSGAIDDSEISKLGKQFGARFVCVTDLTTVFNNSHVSASDSASDNFHVSARIIDIETAEVVAIGEDFTKLQNSDDLKMVLDKVANQLLGLETKPAQPMQTVQETTPAPAPTNNTQMTDNKKRQGFQELERKKQEMQREQIKIAEGNRPQGQDLKAIVTRYEKMLDQCVGKKSGRCADVMYTLGALYYDQAKDNYAEELKTYHRSVIGQWVNENVRDTTTTKVYSKWLNENVGITAPKLPVPDYSKSLGMYWRLTREYPKFEKLPEAYFQMSTPYLVSGQLDSARIVLEQLVNRFPSSPRVSAAHFRLGDLAFVDKNFKKAYMYFKKVKRNEVDRMSWEMTHYRMGECAYNTGDFNKAVEYFHGYVEAYDKGAYKTKDFRDMALECLRLIEQQMTDKKKRQRLLELVQELEKDTVKTTGAKRKGKDISEMTQEEKLQRLKELERMKQELRKQR